MSDPTGSQQTPFRASPDPNNVLLDRYEANVAGAERLYYRKIEAYGRLEAESGATLVDG